MEISKIINKFGLDKKFLFIDETFLFDENEKNEYSFKFSKYEKNLKDIEELQKRENRYCSLEIDDIIILLESKLDIIYKIQEEVKLYRKFKRILDKSNDFNDTHENFYWGGLSGDEAYTAYWNCD
ncbi:hypothetical protein PG326_00005 [Riemerella anatipestifer]|nr:hypothetical protein [Riemerella anatipestifer]MDY3356719.1 hypothetical protein [Riemerella anatipestifer]